MADIFVSYKFTGEPLDVLDEELGLITTILKESGHNTYCSLYDQKILEGSMSVPEIYQHCLDIQKQYKNLFVYTKFIKQTIDDNKYSTGVDKEVKKAKELDQHITLYTPLKPSTPFYREDAHQIKEYLMLKDLQYFLHEMKFK